MASPSEHAGHAILDSALFDRHHNDRPGRRCDRRIEFAGRVRQGRSIVQRMGQTHLAGLRGGRFTRDTQGKVTGAVLNTARVQNLRFERSP